MASATLGIKQLGRGLRWLFAFSLFLYAVWPWLPGQRSKLRTVVVYGFSILGEVMQDAIFPAFQKHWEQKTGEKVEVISAFGGSGTITQQIVLGVPAQIAILATELDAMKLESVGRVAPASWRRLPQAGVLNRTPFVLLVRDGNPRRLKDYADLTRQGLEIVHPDPLTSGGAQWAILAEYGSAPPEKAEQQLLGIWRNVVAQASSARAARTQFDSGLGDCLITYEQDLLKDLKSKKLRGDIVYPRSTILSEHTVVRVGHNITKADEPLVDALIEYLWTEEAQLLFAKHGFRSLDERYNAGFVTIQRPFTIRDMGGWADAKKNIIDAVWHDRVLREVGK